MQNGLIFDWAWYWFVIIAVIAAIVSYGFYYFKGVKQLKAPLKPILATLRFLSLFLLGILLMNLAFKNSTTFKEKPIFFIVEDVSKSTDFGVDSSQKADKINDFKSNLTQSIGNKGIIKTIYVASNAAEEVNDVKSINSSNISSVFQYINKYYSNSFVKGVFLISDGIHNVGLDLETEVQNFKTPIYTIGLGDSTIRKDLKIKTIQNNKIAYKGNLFPVRVGIKAQKLKGEIYKLSIYKGKKVVSQNQGIIDDDNFYQTLDFDILAEENGNNYYSVNLNIIDEEINKANNNSGFEIEVIDEQQNVLLVSHGIHPDFGALKTTLENQKTLKIDAFQNQLPDNIEKYSLCIALNMPANNGELEFLRKFKDQKKSILYQIGTQTNPALFNSLNSSVKIADYNNSFNEATPIVNSSFGVFSTDEIDLKILEKLPPLVNPYGKYIASENLKTLMLQKIGTVKTNYPLIAFAQNTETKEGFILGEGLWHWKLKLFENTQNHSNFNNLFKQSIKYLAVKDDKRRFRVNNFSNTYVIGENIGFTAQLYNQGLEPVTEPDVAIELKSEEGKKYNYVFSRRTQDYILTIGSLPSGSYRYKANAKYSGESFQVQGKFVVKNEQPEFTETTANFSLLRNIATNSNAKFCLLENNNELLELFKMIQKLEVAQKLKNRLLINKLIDYKLFFFLIFTLLSLEWLLRKINGL